MGRNVTLDFSAGGGSDTEFLIGTITLEATAVHEIGNRVVLPAPRATGINAGVGVLEDVAISPAGPEPAWAYRATVRDSISGKSQSWLVGVPTGTSAIPFKQLTKFTTTIPPQTTAGMMQNWADTTEANAERSELAADRAEAPTDEMNKNLIENPASLTSGALSAAIGESIELGGVARPVLDEAYLPATVMKPTPTPPAGFRGLTRLPTPAIRRTLGLLAVTLDLTALRPPTGVTYYTNPDAPGVADGLTPATAARIATILAKPDVGTIICADGEYRRDIVATVPATRSINWIAAPGAKPKFTGLNGVTSTAWTLTSGNIYQTSRSGTTSVVDVNNLTSWGDFTMYVKRANLAGITGPGQWATEGSIVYVWALGSTNLSSGENRAQIRLQIAASTGVIAGPGTTQYVEGIEFWGCASNTSSAMGGIVAQGNALIIAKNAKVKYNIESDGFIIDGGHLIAVDCEASSNARDGFNYHDMPGNGGEFIEINCSSHHNGLVNPGTNNASTAHEAVTGIRINGQYTHAGGPVVADVNSAHTWNLGCYAGGTGPGAESIAVASWHADSTSFAGNPAQQWLDECASGEATYSYATTGTGSQIHLHGTGADKPALAGARLPHYTR